jgi:hypothetical protein
LYSVHTCTYVYMYTYVYVYIYILIIITKSLWHHHLLIFTTSPSSFSWAPGNVTTSSFPSPGSCDRNARGITEKTYGGFNGDTLKWMVYNGKSDQHGCFLVEKDLFINGWFRGTTILGHLHMEIACRKGHKACRKYVVCSNWVEYSWVE